MRADDLRLELKRAIATVRTLGFDALELSAQDGEVSPKSLSASGRRHLARLVVSNGLDLASLGVEFRGKGIADPAHVDECIHSAIETLRLAADMGANAVSCDLGGLDLDALRTLADHADRYNTPFAIRASTASPRDLEALIHAVDCPLIRASIDPAAMLMAGWDPIQGVEALGSHLALTYVRDAVRGASGRSGYETALGAGSLDLHAYLAAASGCNVVVPPILRRAESADPVADIQADKDKIGLIVPA